MSPSKFEKRKEKMSLYSDFIEKDLIENISQSSNVSENRRKTLRGRKMVFQPAGLHLSKELSDTEESKHNVTFNLSSIGNNGNKGDAHSSSIYFSGNDNNSSLDVQYISSASEDAIKSLIAKIS